MMEALRVFIGGTAEPSGGEEESGGEIVRVPAARLPATLDGHERKLGVVLGAGVARGWAHIGVLQALDELGVHPHIVCGCSSGAIVAAAYAAGRLDALADRVTSLTLRQVFGLLDVSFQGGGLLEGNRVTKLFREVIGDPAIEDLRPLFGAVATELSSGRELWLTSGSVADALRASIALPGVLVPYSLRGRWLIDGAMSNPLPVSLCRALGADVIVGVALNGSLFSHGQKAPLNDPPQPLPGVEEPADWLHRLSLGNPFGWRSVAPPARANNRARRPGYFEVMTQTVFLAQDFVSRVRMAADPVDLLISPAAGHIGLMDFHRGAEAIEAGRDAVRELAGPLLAAWARTGVTAAAG